MFKILAVPIPSNVDDFKHIGNGTDGSLTSNVADFYRSDSVPVRLE